MYVHAVQISVLLVLSFNPPTRTAIAIKGHRGQEPTSQTAPEPHRAQAPSKQLFAVRGEVTKMESQSKGLVAITVRPAHEVATVTVIARENDVVGTAVSHKNGADLVGLLGGDDQRENERITAAEIREGDLVSVIYDPMAQNRVLEIYIH
jgi:hypothetical protein